MSVAPSVALDATPDANLHANRDANLVLTQMLRLLLTDLLHSLHFWRIRVEAVRVNQRRDCMSPVVASIYCSPHPAPLQIAPAARLREFCLYDLAPGELLWKDVADLCLARTERRFAVLLIRVRQVRAL